MLLERLEVEALVWDSRSDSLNNPTKLAHQRMSYLCHSQESSKLGGCYPNSRHQGHTAP